MKEEVDERGKNIWVVRPPCSSRSDIMCVSVNDPGRAYEHTTREFEILTRPGSCPSLVVPIRRTLTYGGGDWRDLWINSWYPSTVRHPHTIYLISIRRCTETSRFIYKREMIEARTNTRHETGHRTLHCTVSESCMNYHTGLEDERTISVSLSDEVHRR